MRNVCLFSIALISVSWFFQPKLRQVLAVSTQLINTQVQVSVCGNSIIEGGEDCEGGNLGGATCLSLGYGGGELWCDNACSFDVFSCLPPTPTPTPIFTPTPTIVPTTTPQPTATPQTETLFQSVVETLSPTPTPTPAFILDALMTELNEDDEVVIATVLPVPLQQYDFREEGVLRLADLTQVVSTWVQQWQNYLGSNFLTSKPNPEQSLSSEQPSSLTSDQTAIEALNLPTQACDLNQDGSCNLIDFSILLHYIDG
jgi:hypothetical protein